MRAGAKAHSYLRAIFGIRRGGKSCPKKKLLFAEVAND
jgi:hypothetical protein